MRDASPRSLRNTRLDEMMAGMDEDQFEAVRKWGEGLQGDPREEISAAGKAIVLLSAEVERLEREVWSLKTAVVEPASADDGVPDVSSTDDEETGTVDATLRARARLFVGGLYSRPARR